MVFTPHHTNHFVAAGVSRSRRWLSLVVLGCLVLGVAGYLALTNSLATKGYTIKELQQTLEEMKVTTQRLEAQAAELQSFKTLDDAAIPEGFVAVERVEYLAATPQVGVAVK